MSRPPPLNHSKLAEKLTILNDRIVGLMTRLYHMKFVLTRVNYRPKYLPGGDKAFEGPLKTLLKKFPSLDAKANSSGLQPLSNIRNDILNQLAVHYYTLIDVLEAKDHFTELLGRISSAHVQLDISINFDLTRSYLDLVANYFGMMILLSRIEDRKAILCLFNFSYEVTNASPEKTYPRVSHMLVALENPLRQLHTELNPHAVVLSAALKSLADLFFRRTTRAKNWQEAQLLSLLADPAKMVHTAMIDTMSCELLSADTMERWIIFGYLMIYPELNNEQPFQLWKTALTSSYVVVIFRDEVMHIHPVLIQFFEPIRNYNKRVTEVKEFYNQACTYAPQVHRDRRKYLRTALKELTLILNDEPGLLGPKAFMVLWGLSYARDEIHWLLRHMANPPPKKSSAGNLNIKVNPEDFIDRYIPELLFYIEELRGFIMRYIQVIQRFYAQMLSGYDAPALGQIIKTMSLPTEELTLLSSIYQQLMEVSVEQVYRDELFNFSGIRMDWFRIQTYMSVNGSQVHMFDHRKFAGHMNSTMFHTKMMDFLDEMLRDCSDLSLFYFYQGLLEDYFKKNIEFPAQHRYVIVIPMVCAHFMNACHELCPEERILTGETAFRMAYKFCKEICKELCNLIIMVCEEQSKLSYELLPRESVNWLQDGLPGKKKKSYSVSINQSEKKSRSNSIITGLGPPQDTSRPLPGSESFRRYREEFTRMDKLHMALSELCVAVNHVREITVWERGLVPREMFVADLEESFCKTLGDSGMFRPEMKEIAKPTELLNCVRAQMNVLMDLENYISIDITRVFSNVLLQHTQPRDSQQGRPTLTAHYTKWYTEVLLPYVMTDHVLYSPLLKSFVTVSFDVPPPFHPEEYADLNELRALADLLGPYGIKYLSERILQEVTKMVDELKKLVLQNRDTLETLRCSFDDPYKTRELTSVLLHPDLLLKHFKNIGILLAFRALCLEALRDVLKDRTSFLMASVWDLRLSTAGDARSLGSNSGQLLAPAPPSGEDRQALNDLLIVNELANAMGFPTYLDSSLCSALRHSRLGSAEEDYQVSCLLFVYLATALPRLAKLDSSLYRIELEAHANNIHCIAFSLNALEAAMFTITGHGHEVEARLKEFLALASSNLLRMSQEASAATVSGTATGDMTTSSSSGSKAEPPPKNRDSVYILLDTIVQQSPYLTTDLLESCFPYSLVRNAYHNIAKITRASASHKSAAR